SGCGSIPTGAGAGSAYACWRRWRRRRAGSTTERCTSTPTGRWSRRSRCMSGRAIARSSATTTIRTRRRGSPRGWLTDGRDLERLGAGAGSGHDVAGPGDPMALVALEHGVDARAAPAMRELDRWPFRVYEVALTPLGDRDQHRVEVEPLLGEPVLVPRALA